MRVRAWVVLAGLACGLVCSSPLRAQDSAAAAGLYDKGLADMKAGNFAAACPLLAESYRLDPLPGALFTLADCEAKAGRIATAAAKYEEYLALFSRMSTKEQKGQRGREKLATKAREGLLPDVPMVAFKLPANAPPGTTVKRDGVMLNAITLGVPLPIDPGDHVLVTQVPGGPEREQKISVALREKKDVELEITLAPATEPSASAAASAGAPPPVPTGTGTATTTAPTSSQRPPDQPPPKAGTSHTGAWVFGAIGLAGLAVGGVTGVMALGQKKTVDDNCQGLACNDKGMDAVDQGRTLGLVSTIGFGVGGAALATSLILLIAGGGSDSSRSTAARPSVRPVLGAQVSSGPMFGLQGSW